MLLINFKLLVYFSDHVFEYILIVNPIIVIFREINCLLHKKRFEPKN